MEMYMYVHKHAHMGRYVDNIAYIFGNAAATYIIAGACMHERVRAHTGAWIAHLDACQVNACSHACIGPHPNRGGLLALRHDRIERLHCGTRPLRLRMFVHANTRTSAQGACTRVPCMYLYHVQTVHLYYSENLIPPALQRLLKKDEQIISNPSSSA